ncbi:mitochondrial carrier protein [Stylonychia lemnae]|uniref:Mitochondrial carrier protein n=1 Tax=Stylonychia lemnae TaxID=5949 RepID=A0A078AC70_STYLE|nr:mitochondrial carrier protein [Stylonychia lemnae]|eukprot:CDW79824.1 mitochondrial carrier protein [Stylonychia lemnae]
MATTIDKKQNTNTDLQKRSAVNNTGTQKQISAKVRFLSSNWASIISVTFCFPLEVLKTRLQIQGQMSHEKYGVLSLKKIIQEEGFRGLYRGYQVSVFCIPLFHTIYFPLYESTKLRFKEDYGWQDDSFKLYSASAGISGLICNIITNPFWVVRTRMQAEIFRSAQQEHYERVYQGLFHSLNKIRHEEGARALFSGLTASILGISHALIYFPLYEKSKLYFKRTFQPDEDKLSGRYVFLSAILSKFLRARQQDSRKTENSSNKLRHVLMNSIRKEGYLALRNQRVEAGQEDNDELNQRKKKGKKGEEDEDELEKSYRENAKSLLSTSVYEKIQKYSPFYLKLNTLSEKIRLYTQIFDSSKKSPESGSQTNKLQKYFGPYNVKRLKGSSVTRNQIKGRKVSFNNREELSSFQVSRNYNTNNGGDGSQQLSKAQRLLQENLRYKLGAIEEGGNSIGINQISQISGNSMVRMSGNIGDYIKNTVSLQQKLQQSSDLAHLEQANTVKNDMKEKLKSIIIKRRAHVDEVILSPLQEEEIKIKEDSEEKKHSKKGKYLRQLNTEDEEIDFIRGHRHYKSHIPKLGHHQTSNPRMNQTQNIVRESADQNRERMIKALNKESLYKKFVNSFLLKNDIITKSLDNRLHQIQNLSQHEDQQERVIKKKTRNKIKQNKSGAIHSNKDSNSMNVSLPSIKNIYSKHEFLPKSSSIVERARLTYQTPKAQDQRRYLQPIQDDPESKITSKFGSRAQSMSHSQTQLRHHFKNISSANQQLNNSSHNAIQEGSHISGDVNDPIFEVKKKKYRTKRKKNKSKKRDFTISKSFLTTNEVYMGVQ